MRAPKTLLIAVAMGAAVSQAALAIATVTVFGLKAPEEISGFTLNDSVNYERSKPGDGYGLDYSQPGWKLDVYVYDLKRAAIPPDAKSAIVRAEFERSREDTFLAQPRGLYAQVYLRRNFTIEDPKKETRFQCAAFHMTRDGAKPQDGFMCVTSWNNKFVKFRMTTLADKETEQQARSFVSAWIPVLWGGGQRNNEVRKPDPRDSRAQQEPQRPQPQRAQPQAAPQQQQPQRRPPPPRRRFVCPEGYICETR
jgi:hypothetical protein